MAGRTIGHLEVGRTIGHLEVGRYVGCRDGRAHFACICRAPCGPRKACGRAVELSTRQILDRGHCGCLGQQKPADFGRLVTYRGRSMSMAAWARVMTERGVTLTADCLRKRLDGGWSPARALHTPMGKPVPRRREAA